MAQQLEPESTGKIPESIKEYVKEKTVKNGEAGRKHFLSQIKEAGRDPENVLLNILELAWIKNCEIVKIARKNRTKYHTIYRMLQDLAPFKDEIISFLTLTPRRKQWYNRATNTSDYETVQLYIERALRKGLKNYRKNILTAGRCWTNLHYKNPENWTANEVTTFLRTLPKAMASGMLDAIRVVAPQISDKLNPHYIETAQWREGIGRRKKEIFSREIKRIIKALDAMELQYEKTIFQLHVALGAREGSNDTVSGITGISFDRFKDDFKKVDLYESKVRGGIWCRDCPVDLLFPHLTEEIEKLWIQRGKPTTKKLIEGGYKELREIYKRINQAQKTHWKNRLKPDVYQTITTLRPHDSDKIHCNLLWEAKVPLEVVAGEYLGNGEGIGLVGRIWLDINTIKKHYLTLTGRSQRIQRIREKVRKYARQFNGVNKEA